MRTAWLIAAGVVVAFGLADAAFGQSTRNGMFGQTSVGGSAASRTPTASTGARTSTGTSAGGTTGTTQGGVSAAASTGAPNVAIGAQNAASAVTLNQTRGAFVGADSSDAGVTNARSLMALQGGAQGGAAGRSNTSGLNQLGNLFSQGLQQLNQQNQRATRPKIRTPLRMGFQPQPVSLTHVRNFETRLTRLPGVRFVGAPEVMLEGRTAVLKGTVASEDDRRLAEALAKMDPEVLAVRNELKVDSSATRAAEELPAARP